MIGEITLDRDPYRVFKVWFEEAARTGIQLPDAATLATATRDGRPSARMVLYKGISDGGFLIFTNYESRKAREMDVNPNVALDFHWARLGRQIRIEGRAHRSSPEMSSEYFATRPRESQLGAWASPQSEEIESREELDQRVNELDREYAQREIPCPPFWGGYVIHPHSFEFWIGRDGRLHDRFLYKLEGRDWTIARLAP
jgi:pyridoxamine 5'-phosphate oxidase